MLAFDTFVFSVFEEGFKRIIPFKVSFSRATLYFFHVYVFSSQHRLLKA